MNSSRSIVIFFIIALIAAAFWGAIRYFNFLQKKQDDALPFIHHEQNIPAIIRITSQGFEPQSMTIAKGATVEFVNDDTRPHWPASDIHPHHTQCPGFDALRGLQKGERYTRAFFESKTCSFHDHLDPSLRGVIIVK